LGKESGKLHEKVGRYQQPSTGTDVTTQSGEQLQLSIDKDSKGEQAAVMSCRTTVTIHGIKIDAIVDTGAVRTMMSDRIYKQLSGLLGILQVTQLKLNSASGDQCKIKGEVEVPFKIKNQEYTQKVLVSSMGGIELLLGMDFLYKIGATIDLDKGVLTLPNEAVSLRAQRLSPTFPIRLHGASTIEASMEEAVLCECPGCACII
jgi:predicted aspartyl protease